MKEPKTPPPPPVTVTYLYPPPATADAAIEGPSQAEALKAGELLVLVNTDGAPATLVIQHNFNLTAGELQKRMPDVTFEPEDVDFYAQKPTIVKRAANSISIALNSGEAIFGHKPTVFAIKLKRYYTTFPPPPPVVP